MLTINADILAESSVWREGGGQKLSESSLTSHHQIHVSLQQTCKKSQFRRPALTDLVLRHSSYTHHPDSLLPHISLPSSLMSMFSPQPHTSGLHSAKFPQKVPRHIQMKDFVVPAQIKLTRWTQQQHAQEPSLQSENKHHRHSRIYCQTRSGNVLHIKLLLHNPDISLWSHLKKHCPFQLTSFSQLSHQASSKWILRL